MKKIAIVSNRKSLGEHIKMDMEAYFKEYASFCVYSAEDIQNIELFEEDAVILSSWRVFDMVKAKLRNQTALEVISLTLSRENLQHMEEIRQAGKVLLVNYDYRVCMQVITQFYELGYDDIDFVPYWGPETKYDSDIQVAVTPNEAQLVPPGVKVYDIGERVVEPNCVLRLATKLGIEGIFDSAAAETARKNVALPQWGLDSLLWETSNTKNNIRAVIEHIDDGVLICDNQGECYLGNEKSKELLKLDSVEGLNVLEFISRDDLEDESLKKKTVISAVDGKRMVFTVTAIVSRKGKEGNLIEVRNFEEAEERQHRLRNKVVGEKHEARYTFSDMKGESKAIRDVITLAKRMAKSGSSVMITGESGTGKEVLAQSIHNESSRRKYNFVALNCAAIPENLLESELFGYEEGAFTGAKKGGKIGYFELAHKGTIFLDEIGEMPLALQGKLLRVIEEQKVARIGSSRLIDIDVRIIAATNKNIIKLIEKGAFREDLYYRLNVLPLNLPNVNQRGEDILLLFDNFREKLRGEWTYSEEVRKILLRHKWRGNIREIRNVVEYLDNVGKKYIEPEDLPESFSSNEECEYTAWRSTQKFDENTYMTPLDTGSIRDIMKEKELWNFVLKEGLSIPLHLCVLEALLYYKTRGMNVGRNQIKQYMDEKGYRYSLAEIRSSMHRLSEMGYLRAMKGRGGSQILAKGEMLLETLKGFEG